MFVSVFVLWVIVLRVEAVFVFVVSFGWWRVWLLCSFLVLFVFRWFCFLYWFHMFVLNAFVVIVICCVLVLQIYVLCACGARVALRCVCFNFVVGMVYCLVLFCKPKRMMSVERECEVE